MKNIVTTIIDIDALVAESAKHHDADAAKTNEHTVLRLTLEWVLDVSDAEEAAQTTAQDTSDPGRSDSGAGTMANDNAIGDPNDSGGSQPNLSWQDTIAQFPDH